MEKKSEIGNYLSDAQADPVPSESIPDSNNAGGVTPAATAIATIAEKKPVGRPKKNKVNTQIKVYGIQPGPQQVEDTMELVYDNPQLFKKIIQIFTSYQAGEIEFLFDPNGVKLFAVDHQKHSNIYIALDGRGMNRYYCKEQFRVCVKRALLDAVFQTVGKTHYKITFVARSDHRSKLYCIINSSSHNNDKTFEIPVILKQDQANFVDDDSAYPVKFTLSSPAFKDLVNPKLGTSITIEKRGSDPLQLVYDKVNQLACIDRYPDPAKINLESTVQIGDIFSATVQIKHIHCLASKNIGNTVQICAHGVKPISFTTTCDRRDDITVATVKVFTKLQ